MFKGPHSRHFAQGRSGQQTLESVLSQGFPYSRKLSAHTSCVNALAFSSGGRFLASGGDDLKVHLWDFHQEDVKAPCLTLRGAENIIFTIAFSASNQYLYSGGTDCTIRRHDISHLDSYEVNAPNYPQKAFNDNDGHLRSISCHPRQEELFMTASEDGSVRRYDCRVRRSRCSRAQDTIQINSEVTDVKHHPTMDNIFATSDNRGNVYLRDERMAFGPLQKRSNQGIVQTYNTKLTRKGVGYLSNPESSSIAFDREGSKLVVTMLHYLPTLYSISDPNPVAVFSGKNLPDGSPNPPGKRTYSNSCTMKHGSFGGPGLTDEFYCAGSDDFRAYLWKIPSITELTERRREIISNDWNIGEFPNIIAFSEGFTENKFIPVNLSTPFCRLTGHQSIVNTTLIHPSLLHIVTSGIEKNIVLHSPTTSSPCTQNLHRSPSDVRELSDNVDDDRSAYIRALGFSRPDVLSGDDTAERITLSMFDHILREEGEADVFEIRKWMGSESSSDEDLDVSSSDDSYAMM
ncbi:WD40 repeat-like protein [Cyathus striatus]|nr:WD40 repeat-like protein [Cyathus striatus]